MIVGIGVDLCSVTRMAAAIARHPGLAERLEIGGSALSAESLAARFAAKEALIKAFGSIPGGSWHNVKVVVDDSGAPMLSCSGAVLAAFEQRGVTHSHLSLSHDDGMAIAMVVLEADISDRHH